MRVLDKLILPSDCVASAFPRAVYILSPAVSTHLRVTKAEVHASSIVDEHPLAAEVISLQCISGKVLYRASQD